MLARFSNHLQNACCSIVIALFLLPGCAISAQGQTSSAAELTPVVQSDDIVQPSAQRALHNFYHDLQRLQTGQINQLNILQIGDSHTANNFFSGRLRDRFQEKFGNAGRGMMPPGVVYPGISQQDVKPSMGEGWAIENSLKNPAGGFYGISGFLTRSTQSGARLDLTATDTSFDWIAIDYLTQPHGGKFQVLLDGKVIALISTTGPNGHLKQFATSIAVAKQMSVIALDKGITLTEIGTARRTHGIIYTSHGVVSATASLYEHWNADIILAEVQALRPSLIVIAYGTNEAFEANFDPITYAKGYMYLIAMLHRAAPNASVLMVGPPDSQKAESNCTSGLFTSCNWQTPPSLDNVRAIQRQIAVTMGADFWDWAQVMPDGIGSWVDSGKARSDHVHMTPAGYEVSGDALFDRLMKGYNLYQSVSPRRG